MFALSGLSTQQGSSGTYVYSWIQLLSQKQLSTFQLFLYLGRLLHLIRQIGGERSDGQLCVGGDLEPAGEGLDYAVHFWVVVQGNVFSFPDNKNSYGNVMRLCDWDVGYRSLSMWSRVPLSRASRAVLCVIWAVV